MSPVPLPPQGLNELFGSIDVYLFDQLLRGRLAPPMRVLDAGCGTGRNLHYLAQAGFDVWGVDRDATRVDEARARVTALAPDTPPDRFLTADLASLPFADGQFDAVICNAVLHFCETPEHLAACLDACWRTLADGGLLWARLASSIGIEDRVTPLDGRPGWHRLPDGSDRLLVDEAQLLEHTRRLGAALLDPIKTTNVQGLRCMTTWVLRKDGA